MIGKIMTTTTMSDTDKALTYYRAAVEDRRPDFVPAKVRLARPVCGDGPFRTTKADAGEYSCETNQWGAVSVMASNGKMLGVKPAEFEVIEWRDNLVTAEA
jgi:hypothetical protein